MISKNNLQKLVDADTPSKLLRLAVSDLAKVEKTPGYKINMGTWHKPWDKTCHVCFAGAVLANTCGVGKTRDVTPRTFGIFSEEYNYLADRIAGLNDAREGAVAYYCRRFSREAEQTFETKATRRMRVRVRYPEPTNREQRKMFREDMLKIATKLEKIGL